MRRYLIIILRSIVLFMAVSFSLGLLLARKVIHYFHQRPGSLTPTQPIGVKPVVRKSTQWITWGIGKIRGLIAIYIRDYHPSVWRRFRDYLRARR